MTLLESTGLTATERTLRARMGGYALAAQRDSRITSQPARDAFFASFLDRIPTDLPEVERQRRATAARRQHMLLLAYKSMRVRAKARERQV